MAYTQNVREAGELGYDRGFTEVSKIEGAFGASSSATAIASLTGVLPHDSISVVEDLLKLQSESFALEFGQTTRLMMQRALVTGMSSRQAASALAKEVGATLDVKRWQLERDLRTGINAAANVGHNKAYARCKEELDDLKRQGHETLYLGGKKMKGGKQRSNHPFSKYLHGSIAEIEDPWKVKVPRKFSGMFWSYENGFYIGQNYPAHINERGRQIPYRDAWNTR